MAHDNDQKDDRYGEYEPETPVKPIRVMEDPSENPNDIKTKRNITMLEHIRGDNSDKAHETGYGRAMSA